MNEKINLLFIIILIYFNKLLKENMEFSDSFSDSDSENDEGVEEHIQRLSHQQSQFK